MRAIGGTDALLQRERLPVGRGPAGNRRGVLGEKADQLAARALGAEVAGAPVAELGGVDLEQLHSRRAGDLKRAVARARVDHEHIVDALARERVEQLRQIALAVLDGYHDRHRWARRKPRSRAQPALGPSDRPADRTDPAQRAAQLRGAGPAHQRVQVEVPAVEPVDALLGLGDDRVRPGLRLHELGLERGHARAQALVLG